jgi:hypothetical protein
MNLDWIVTGTGRCGTVYAAKLLTSAGIPCGHEAFFKSCGIVDKPNLSYCSQHEMLDDGTWKPLDQWVDIDAIRADSSYMAAPYLGLDWLQETKVIHLVRNPIQVVDSFCNCLRGQEGYFTSLEPNNEYEEFIYNNIGELKKPMPQYDRGALFYVLWNKMIERRSDVKLVRVEKCPSRLFDVLGTRPEVHFQDKKANAFPHPRRRFTPDDIESREIKSIFMEMGKRYGYSMTHKEML